MIDLKHILVAVDFDETSDKALAYARSLAKNFGAQLHLMHVMENQFLRPLANDPHDVEVGIGRRLADRLTADERASTHAVAVLRTSDAPAEAIVKYAGEQPIDLIVIGTHGRSGITHVLMGSVAEKVVRGAPCPVLIVRPGGREFVHDTPASS